ncbi:DMT family transporter [Aestuariirhabdus litorea]|uniref:DMT family transporter n=1 Tax=Aestuariirhabdus litorea TaxID=2528527 RepID=A0A3P3VSP2_9GAMM|nr:DMT family transporter [Aestuariirhabdus litorea]RRJ84509.1 DMT family transporter [Aestuariirhabdus litorea]RWW97734.1 DMT family transporter [Endozoicomonadaceae bacterium GTF-13]
MAPQRQAYLYGIGAVLLWSTVATAFKLSLRYLDTLQLLLYSCLSSILVMLGILAVQGKLSAIWPLLKTDYRRWLLLGLLNPFGYYLILFQAYDLLPAQQAQPLNYTWGITLALLSIPLLGQRISRWEIIACLISYLGVVVIATRGDLLALQFDSPLGVALALVSTVIWALYWILNTKNQHDPVVSLLLCFCFSLPFILATTLIFSSVVVSDWRGLAGAFYVGVFEMGFAFVLWLSAMKRATNTAKVSNLIFLSPFLSLYLIATFVGESIHPATYAGLLLILAGVVLQSRLGGAKAG